MNTEQKLNLLYEAVNKAWTDGFDGWDWLKKGGRPSKYILGESSERDGFAFFLGANEDVSSGLIWIEYEPELDMVEIHIKFKPILACFKEDFTSVFEKHSPFGVTLSFERTNTPILVKKEKVEPKDFEKFFKAFKKAYKENFPLFYMFTICQKEWFEEFSVLGMDC